LVKYFCFVGSALVLLLFGLDWFLPRPVSDPSRWEVDRSVKRVVIDTNLPMIVPPLECNYVC
jgi:hypothetical protein